jgi:integrase
MRAELTDRRVREAKAGIKARKITDGGGLFLFVTPAGGKLWRWKYRYQGTAKLMALGQFPAVSLASARKRHSEGRELLASGVDPMEQRRVDKAKAQQEDENSFAMVAAKWLEHWRDGKSPRHADTMLRRMEANLFPTLGTRPIAMIEAPELVRVVKAIEERGAGDLAKRALQTTGQIFRYAIAHGYAKRNPASEIKPADILKSTHKTNLARIDAKELPDLLKAIEVYQGTQLTRLAFKLMTLTFVRTTELIGAKWSEFDIKAHRWDIPAPRMKMKTPHIVPLARQTLEVLESLKLISGDSEYLFPGDRKGATMSNNTILQGLERMGYKHRMTGHGFRGLASTILHERGYQHDHIELQLAHTPRNAVSASYNHALYLQPRTKMMQDWADFLESTQRGVKVLPFRSRVG